MKIAVAGATGRLGRHVSEVLAERGHEVVAISRAAGVDIITGAGLDAALNGVEVIVDAATGPSPDQQPATEFFVTAAHNLQEAGVRAGVRRAVVVSIINIDKSAGGYGLAKIAHEDAWRSGPIPVRIVRAAQFHEFVAQLLEWGTQGDVAYIPEMRTQIVSARTVAEVVADIATSDGDPAQIVEIAGPREEDLAQLATMLVARRGTPVKVLPRPQPGRPRRRHAGNGRHAARPGGTAGRSDVPGVARPAVVATPTWLATSSGPAASVPGQRRPRPRRCPGGPLAPRNRCASVSSGASRSESHFVGTATRQCGSSRKRGRRRHRPYRPRSGPLPRRHHRSSSRRRPPRLRLRLRLRLRRRPAVIR